MPRTYNPDKWSIIKIKHSDEEIYYKVYGNWSGGYLDGDSWRLSSGLEKITDDGDFHLMHNYSGSIYRCHKKMEGMNGFGAGVFSGLTEQAKKVNVEFTVISLEDYLKETGEEKVSQLKS
jgi:hypothetical protein